MKNKVISMFGNHKVVQNSGVKYSELLEQFMTPFAGELDHLEYVEDIFEFAIHAWNLANINSNLPKEEIANAMKLIEAEKEDFRLLKKMLAYKEKKFKTYTNFIVDFELKEAPHGGDPVLSVVTQEEEAYLATMLSDLENDGETSEDDFKENYVNRSAIIIKPKQAFLDWFKELYPDEEIDEVSETNIYLVSDEIDDLEAYLRKKYDTFFKMELEEWHTGKKEWPHRRNYKMFKLWFHAEVSSLVYDLEKRPISKA